MELNYRHDLAAVAHIDVVPKILEIICRTTGMGFSAVARVTEERWIACAVRDEIAFGLQPGGELDVRTTICDEIRESGELVVIDDVAADPHYCTHHTTTKYGFRSYISVPLRYPDGRFFGTLCAIDPRPARVNTPETVGMFRMFADLIGFHLESYERLNASELALRVERHDAVLRDQFIAVLGHDLRNPLAAVAASAEVLASQQLPGNGSRMVSIIQRSTLRMTGLIENLMDFARAKMSDGLPIAAEPVNDLGATIEEVVGELRASWPLRQIDTELALTAPVPADRARIAQLLSNLVANALTHGDAAGPVVVRAATRDGALLVSVENQGAAIAPAAVEKLFKPFARGSASGREGLGLGLFIASEIARAHGGELTVQSDAQLTRFTLRIPLARAV
ncbi:MAG: GAF domain-containing sensor histidine kinase [Vicinamibacterales bacterium]